MKILNVKWVGFALYAMVITGFFLFVLFPSKVAIQWLEARTARSEYPLKADDLAPSLPLGFKARNLTVLSPGPSADVLFYGEFLDVQLNPFSLFKTHRDVRFKGAAYGGQLEGRLGLVSLDRPSLPVEATVRFTNLDLSRFKWQGVPLIKGISGTARGSLVFAAPREGQRGSSGKLAVFLTRGAYPLPEPFLGVSRIEYDRGELRAQLSGEGVKVEKFEFYGSQVNCFLSGDIQLSRRLDESLLNLKGTLEIAGKAKIKMNVTVGGTLASPSFRYI